MSGTMTGVMRAVQADDMNYSPDELPQWDHDYGITPVTSTTMGQKILTEALPVARKSWWVKLREVFTWGGTGRHRMKQAWG